LEPTLAHNIVMVDLSRRLDDLGPAIRELMKLAGTLCLRLSAATKDRPDYHANYGVRDLQDRLGVTEETIFPVCSLARGLSAAAPVDSGIALTRRQAVTLTFEVAR
jgi:CubicO group peptidase (beta-lactamase class C family)